MEVILTILASVGGFVKAHALGFLIILLAVNLTAFAMYGLDKHYARAQKRRIPEANLLLVAALFGASGALLGMHLFRHKTKHKKFTITVPLLLILQIAFFLIILTVR